MGIPQFPFLGVPLKAAANEQLSQGNNLGFPNIQHMQFVMPKPFNFFHSFTFSVAL